MTIPDITELINAEAKNAETQDKFNYLIGIRLGMQKKYSTERIIELENLSDCKATGQFIKGIIKGAKIKELPKLREI